MSNPDDVIRDHILRGLHEVFRNARSVKATAIGIRNLQKKMREEHGYRQQEVAANLTYLIQKGWAEEVTEARSYTTERGTTMPSAKVTYRISDVGIDRIEKASIFRRDDKAQTINITNVRGVTVVGDQNVVNTQFTDASRTLTELRRALLTSEELSDHQKLEAAADIDGLVTQLQKPEPNKAVVRSLWTNVEKLAAAGQLAALAAQAASVLGPLLS